MLLTSVASNATSSTIKYYASNQESAMLFLFFTLGYNEPKLQLLRSALVQIFDVDDLYTYELIVKNRGDAALSISSVEDVRDLPINYVVGSI